jgi:hypothetical protein
MAATGCSRFEDLQFADGTVHVADGDPLFDTLFYDWQNPDVFHANVDARFHYAQVGWLEGRDPNAFFSTDGYLGLLGRRGPRRRQLKLVCQVQAEEAQEEARRSIRSSIIATSAGAKDAIHRRPSIRRSICCTTRTSPRRI